jgi:hypothetical protein
MNGRLPGHLRTLISRGLDERGTVIHKTSGSCMGDFGDLWSPSSADFLGAYQRGISVRLPLVAARPVAGALRDKGNQSEAACIRARRPLLTEAM